MKRTLLLLSTFLTYLSFLIESVFIQISILVGELVFVFFRPWLWRFFITFQVEYFFWSPYYYTKRDCQDDDVFGYTPLFTYHRFIKKIEKITNLELKGVGFLDVGCGDGRGVFFAGLQKKMLATGIDLNKKLIQKGETMSSVLRCPACTFIKGDFREISFSSCAILYLAWSTFKNETILDLEEKMMQELDSQSIVVTLSFPIHHEAFTLIGTQKGLFSWGLSTLYFQRLKVGI
jgi:SAM-dependent methyltransferase